MVNIPEEPEFTMEKLQRIKGEANYTVSELKGKLGQTVEYKIVIKNTGNMPLTFTPLEDPNCEGISPSGTTELNPGKEESFTCTHVLTSVGKYANSASIEANDPIKGKSNEVVVEVPAEPSYTIEKAQRIKGEASYSAAEKTGKLGQTVEYKITVKNTGNVTLKFAALKDTGCEGLLPSGTTELKPGEEETFTCSHVLAVGTSTNEATIEGNEGSGTKTSNAVTVKVPANAAYTIEKQQRIAGEPFFTVSELTAELGETVEYQIIVNNTGNVPLKFAPLKDSGCEGITPSGATEVPVGFGETFLCSHVLGTVGSYTNEASIELKEGGTKNTNKVVVKVPTKAAFTIEKQQRIKGEPTYSAAEHTGALGQTVEYLIVVKNTGNVTLKFTALKDTGCEGITPAGTTELAVGKEESFTCTHVLAVGTYTNEASIEGNEGAGTKTSNKVTAKVPSEPSFTFEKLQRIAGEGSYGTGELSGKLGQTAEYKFVVKNTGNVTLKFGALKDSGCEGITPSGATELKVGEEESFTCTHVLGVGTTTNEATIEGNEGTGKVASNKVTVKVASEPSFTINKEQKIKGEGAFGTSELSGKLGQTAEYKIVVKNTGNLKLKFSALKDTGCEGIAPSGTTELAVGAEESFTCTHVLAVGTTTNEASIEGNEGTGTKTSNKVTINVAAEPNFTIEKQQRIKGEVSYSPGEVSGEFGQTVEYKITVKNTGNLPLKFAALKDSGCEGISPSGTTELAAGKEESFTCTHVLAVGATTNEASIEGNEGTGTKTSNKVTVKVAVSYTIQKLQKLAGEGTFGASEVTGKFNQTVEYKIIVKNTSNITLKFAALKDTGCEGLTPLGATELAAGAEETFTCTHKLAVGTYSNEASIEGNEGTGTKSSNKVTAKVAAEPNFIIEKQQRIAGEGTYTSAEHTGKLGQVVEYKIIVRNTGNVALKFAAIKDTGCTGLTPTGATELPANAGAASEEFFFCTHTLGSVGSYVNEASIEGNEGTGSKTSNKATTKVNAEPNFAIEKQQRVNGEGTFGVSEASGKLGQTVEYKVIVKNTGNVTLKFAALKDTGCEGLTPSGATELAAGAEETFTCSHKLSAVGSYTQRSLDRRQRRHRHQDL